MPRRFFRLFDDVYFPKRWHLGSPIDDQGNEADDFGYFNHGHEVKAPGRLRIQQDVRGRALDYSLAGLNVPVVHARVAEVFTRLAPKEVQLLPVEIARQSDPYFILVVTRLIRCIDETATKFERWTPEDGVPEKVGQYSSVWDLRIDKARVGDAHVFRPEDWEVVIIVSDEIRLALEHIQATGVKFVAEV
ncbi:imm11 family protein [Pyxidicoccus xibeiensis]|uniref:imm11 family protein n=1 Tax=Pyxidicoccus xibeiensis TaxID=2906759 RepID=UPI0020A7CB12|nr:DUF1629 domain-containing protein [Pyxidicoccus xibeiensis]MCP3137272.1 hypothetical protein [Pyxidicoccus xibeiensis]